MRYTSAKGDSSGASHTTAMATRPGTPFAAACSGTAAASASIRSCVGKTVGRGMWERSCGKGSQKGDSSSGQPAQESGTPERRALQPANNACRPVAALAYMVYTCAWQKPGRRWESLHPKAHAGPPPHLSREAALRVAGGHLKAHVCGGGEHIHHHLPPAHRQQPWGDGAHRRLQRRLRPLAHGDDRVAGPRHLCPPRNIFLNQR